MNCGRRLNSILTFSELMEMQTFGEVNDEQRDYLQKILFSGRHLLALINDVLDITKIQSGMLKLFIEDDFDIYLPRWRTSPPPLTVCCGISRSH